MEPDAMSTLLREKEEFEKHRAELERDHPGQFVLQRDGQIIGFYPTHKEGYADGVRRFGSQAVFLVEPTTKSQQEPCVSLTWELGLIHVANV